MDSKQHHWTHLTHDKRNKKRNVKAIGKSTSESQSSANEILANFTRNTTLLGLQHILRTRSFFWVAAYVCCLVMSIVQSWSTAAQYFDKKSHQRYGIQSKREMPFPSVTICNNIVLPLSFIRNGTVPGYNLTIDELNEDNNISEEAIDELRNSNNEAVLNYIRSLSYEQQKQYAVPTKEWLVMCKYNYQDCNRSDAKLFYEFNHPIDGTCLTFNPAFKYSGVEVDIDTKLIITLRRQGIGYQITGGRPHVSVLIHTPGTTPLMDLPEAINILGRQSVNIGLRLTQKDFMLKNLYPVPTCVMSGETGQKYKEKNLYYRQWTPYEYSIEACMKTCIQQKVNKPCGVLDATFPILEDEKGLKIRIPPFAACNKTADLQIGLENCDCPFPCRIYQYYVSTDTTDLAAESQRNDNHQEDHVQRMRVTVQYLSNIYDHIEEELDYNITQFMGILGGNLSLWLGLCILSLLEIIELIWRLVVVGIRNRFDSRISGENSCSCKCKRVGLMGCKRSCTANYMNSRFIIRNRNQVRR